MKYVVAYKVPGYVEQVIRDNYFRITGRDVAFTDFHISLIHPFHLKSTHSEEWILGQIEREGFESLDAWLTRIGVFKQKKKTLFIGVEPKDEMRRVHLKLGQILRKGIMYDSSPFLGGELPIFHPHITIDYDFDGDELTLNSLQIERFEAYFDTYTPKLFRYSDDVPFEEVR